MYKIAVLGDKDSIFAFAALGMEIYPTDSASEAENTVKRLAENGYGIIFVTEELAAKIPDVISEYSYKITPSVILIPGVKGNTGLGRADVEKYIEKAVGSNILE